MSETEALEQRVKALERQSRWFQQICGVAIVILVALFLMEQIEQRASKRQLESVRQLAWEARHPGVRGTVTAERFVVVDKNKGIRGEWFVHSDGTPMLKLLNRDGVCQGDWYVRPNGHVVLRLRDKNGHPNGVWSVSSDGSTQISLGRKDSYFGAAQRAYIGSVGNMILEEAADKTTTDGPSLVLLNKEGKIVFQAP